MGGLWWLLPSCLLMTLLRLASLTNSSHYFNTTEWSESPLDNMTDFYIETESLMTDGTDPSSTWDVIVDNNDSLVEHPSLLYTTESVPFTTRPIITSLPSPSTTPLDADQWPVKAAAEVHGDLILGGLMMVHEREDTITCGPIMPQGGIQAVETMLYTLDIVNNKLSDFSLGAHILDDCDKDTYGLEMAVDFIKGKSQQE